MKKNAGKLVRCIALGLLIYMVVGCNNNQAVQSDSYKKLPPGEGERRLQDTLKRRSEGRSRTAPLAPGESVDQNK